MCERCSVHWYWQNSECFSKSFATCPLCRAEYCLGDIVIYHFLPAESPPSLFEQIAAQKRRLSELEQQLTRESAAEFETNVAKRQKIDSPPSSDIQPPPL
jgi:hypothetical protein